MALGRYAEDGSLTVGDDIVAYFCKVQKPRDVEKDAGAVVWMFSDAFVHVICGDRPVHADGKEIVLKGW